MEINQIRTEHDDWVELFAISDYVPPKFWLGDRVKFYDRVGTVLGLEWRPEESPLRTEGGSFRSGWWYRCRWAGSLSTQGVHQDSLKAYAAN